MCLVGSEGSTILGVDEECHRVAEEALAFGALPDVEGVGVAGEGLIIKVAHFLRNNFIFVISYFAFNVQNSSNLLVLQYTLYMYPNLMIIKFADAGAKGGICCPEPPPKSFFIS